MNDLPLTVTELQASNEWPNILRQLTDLLDTEGIGGVTSEQIETYIREHPTMAKQLRRV